MNEDYNMKEDEIDRTAAYVGIDFEDGNSGGCEEPKELAAEKVSANEDPHRFVKVDVWLLEEQLKAQPLFFRLLKDRNEWLASKKAAQLIPFGVALIGCIVRKNIRQNTSDPGAVPFDAIAEFCRRSDMAKKAPSNLYIRAALFVLENVGFIRQTRSASKANGQCAAYRLVNEADWCKPVAIPSIDPDPKQETSNSRHETEDRKRKTE
jgi:hypothetical protein